MKLIQLDVEIGKSNWDSIWKRLPIMFPIDIDVLGLFQLGSDFTLKYFILQNELLK